MKIVQEMSRKEANTQQRPAWYSTLLEQGFTEQQILFAIEIKGYDGEAVQGFLFDNMWQVGY